MKLLSHVRLLATPWTAAHQAPPSMGFSWQEYWSRVPLPSQATSYCVVHLLKLSESFSPHLINQDNNTHGLMKIRLYRACKRAWLIVVKGLVAQSYLNLCDHCPPTPWTAARQAPLDYGVLQARILKWVAILFSRDLLESGIKPRSPALQAGSLPHEPPGQPL